MHTSSGSVGTHGETTGPPHHDSAEPPSFQEQYAAWLATERDGVIPFADADTPFVQAICAYHHMTPAVWGEWGWTE